MRQKPQNLCPSERSLIMAQSAAKLVADAAGERWVRRIAGFASRSCVVYPGTPRRGSADPGLYSAAPFGAEVKRSGMAKENVILPRMVGGAGT